MDVSLFILMCKVMLGTFPSGNFPRVFSQMCDFPSSNFPSLSLPQRSVIIAACGASEGLT